MLAVQRRSLLNQPLDTVPLTFTRPSVAYTWDGKPLPPNTPRFEQLIDGKLEYGCLIEQAHTNLMSASKSECSSLAEFGLSANGEITTEDFLRSPSCLKITTNSYYTGFWTTESTTVGTVYCYQYMGRIDEGVVIRIETGSTHVDYIGTGEWMLMYFIFEATVSSTDVGVSILAADTHISYFDMFQFTDNPFPLSWTLGGTTQAAETLTAPANSLNIDTSGATPNQGAGTIELEAYVTPYLIYNSAKALFCHQTTTDHNLIELQLYGGAGQIRTITTDSELNVTDLYSQMVAVPGFHRFGVIYSKENLGITTDGADVIKSAGAPYLPKQKGTITFGFNPSYIDYSNTIMRNIIISETNRQDVTARASIPPGQAPKPDRGTMLYAPLTNNLKAYRVRA